MGKLVLEGRSVSYLVSYLFHRCFIPPPEEEEEEAEEEEEEENDDQD